MNFLNRPMLFEFVFTFMHSLMIMVVIEKKLLLTIDLNFFQSFNSFAVINLTWAKNVLYYKVTMKNK